MISREEVISMRVRAQSICFMSKRLNEEVNNAGKAVG